MCFASLQDEDMYSRIKRTRRSARLSYKHIDNEEKDTEDTEDTDETEGTFWAGFYWLSQLRLNIVAHKNTCCFKRPDVIWQYSLYIETDKIWSGHNLHCLSIECNILVSENEEEEVKDKRKETKGKGEVVEEEEEEEEDEEEDDDEEERPQQRRKYYLREHKPRTNLYTAPIGNFC